MALSDRVRRAKVSPHGVRFNDDVVLVCQGSYRGRADTASELVQAQARLEHIHIWVRVQHVSHDECVPIHRTRAAGVVVVFGVCWNGVRGNDQLVFSGVLSERDRPEHGLQHSVPVIEHLLDSAASYHIAHVQKLGDQHKRVPERWRANVCGLAVFKSVAVVVGRADAERRSNERVSPDKM